MWSEFRLGAWEGAIDGLADGLDWDVTWLFVSYFHAVVVIIGWLEIDEFESVS